MGYHLLDMLVFRASLPEGVLSKGSCGCMCCPQSHSMTTLLCNFMSSCQTGLCFLLAAIHDGFPILFRFCLKKKKASLAKGSDYFSVSHTINDD